MTGTQWALAIGAASKALTDQQEKLQTLDSVYGDGDHGAAINSGFAAAAKAVAVHADDAQPSSAQPGDVLEIAADALAEEMGGAAGPLYATILYAFADGFRGRDADLDALAQAASSACEQVGRRGKVQPGDGTLLDALCPFADTLRAQQDAGMGPVDALQAAADQADRGATATIERPKLRGRAAAHPSQGVGAEDPGARSFAVIAKAISKSFKAHTPTSPMENP